MRRLLCIIVLVLTAACGDDGDATVAEVGEPTTSTTAEQPTASETSTTSVETTTTAPGEHQTPAAPPPGDGAGEAEGRDDGLVLIADLTGDASGRAELTATDDGYCIDMEAVGLSSEITDAHVHEGGEGVDGPPVVPIGPPTAVESETDTWDDVCVAVDEALRERIEADPPSFYVNIHTSSSPAGALRGQLAVSTIFDRTLS